MPTSPETREGQREITLKSSPFRISDETKRKMAEIDRRQQRFWQTAHLYWFD